MSRKSTPSPAPEGQPAAPEGSKRGGFLSSLEAMEAALASHPAAAAVVVYVYRLWPIIDRKLTGDKPSYIYRGAGDLGLSSEWLLEQFGSGRYRIDLFDKTIPPSGARIGRCEVVLQDPERVPLLDQAEITIGHPENKGYIDSLRQRGEWKGEAKPAKPADDAAGAVGALTATVENLAGRLAAAAPARSSDDAAGIERALTLLAQMRAAFAPPDNSGLVVDVMKQNQALLGMLVNRASEPQTPARNPIQDFKAVADFLKDLGFSAGGAGGGESSWLVELVKALAPLGAGIVQASIARAAAAPVQAAAPAGLVNPAAALPQPGALSAAPPNQGDGEMKILRLLQVGERALSAFQRGVTGDEFADAFVKLESDGEAVYVELAALGVEQLFSLLQGLPVWASLQADGPRVREWLADFVSYGQPEGAPEGGAAAGAEGGLS